ncbi:MAG TPA: hypothetical protein DHW02_14665, partial [Ktedonobacter sp.]|nr:hypothetical protein [Ktedonobacter sp.]
GWSQEELAEKVGVELRTIRRWEQGKGFPRPYARRKLSEVLGMSIPELGLVDEDENIAFVPDDEQEHEIPVLDDEQEHERFAHRSETETEIPITQVQGTVLRTYNAHSGWVLAVAWEPKGERIASAGGDGVARVWDASSGETCAVYRKHDWLSKKVNWPPAIHCVAWSPDGQYIASAGDGRKVYVWDAAKGETTAIYRGHTGMLPDVFALAWSPDSKYIASACSVGGIDKTIHEWDATSGHERHRYNASYGWMPHFSISAIAWSHDGTRLAAACGDKTIRLWDMTTGELKSTFQASSGWIYTIAWSSDDQRLALAHGNSTAEIIDAFTGQNMLTYRGHRDSVRDIAWSPDDKYLATASNDTAVKLWDAENANHIYTFEGHTSWTTSVAWSPDGTRIASASNDRTVRVWQAV